MAEIKPAHRSARPHGIAFRQLDADALGVEQAEQRSLLGVVGLRRIAGRRTDAAVFFRDQIFGAQRLVRLVAPEFLAHALMQALGESFRQPVGQRLDQDGGVIVVRPFETLGDLVLADAGGHRKGADIVGNARFARRDEIGERGIGAAFALGQLLTQRMQRRERFARVSSANSIISSPCAAAGQKPSTALALNQPSATILSSMARASS